MKVCKKCLVSLPESEFYAHKGMKDGLFSKCKTCVREYQNSLDLRRSPEYQREWRRKHREKHNEYHRKWREKNREKVRAHSRFKYAVKTGKVNREPCEVCGDENSHGHHEDYSKPLEVRWLCLKHHFGEHKKSRTA